MGAARRTTRTFSLDREILSEVKRTRGRLSESERVNRLLRTALDAEKRASLEHEIAEFFSLPPADRAETKSFETATLKSWARD